MTKKLGSCGETPPPIRRVFRSARPTWRLPHACGGSSEQGGALVLAARTPARRSLGRAAQVPALCHELAARSCGTVWASVEVVYESCVTPSTPTKPTSSASIAHDAPHSGHRFGMHSPIGRGSSLVHLCRYPSSHRAHMNACTKCVRSCFRFGISAGPSGCSFLGTGTVPGVKQHREAHGARPKCAQHMRSEAQQPCGGSRCC